MVPFLGTTWLPLVAWLRLGSAGIDAESQSKIRTEFFQQFFFLRQVWSWPKAPDWCSLACKTRNAKPVVTPSPLHLFIRVTFNLLHPGKTNVTEYLLGTIQ